MTALAKSCKKKYDTGEPTLWPPVLEAHETTALGLAQLQPASSSNTSEAPKSEFGLTQMLLEVYAQLYRQCVSEPSLTLADRVDAVVARKSKSLSGASTRSSLDMGLLPGALKQVCISPIRCITFHLRPDRLHT